MLIWIRNKNLGLGSSTGLLYSINFFLLSLSLADSLDRLFEVLKLNCMAYKYGNFSNVEDFV